MSFQICVNAAGCLPDSETYPYEVEDSEAFEALREEIELHADFDEQTAATAEVAEGVAAGMIEAARADGIGIFELAGTYRLTIEEMKNG